MPSAIFTTALSDCVVRLHPCVGVRAPAVPNRPPTVLTPPELDAVLNAVQDLLRWLPIETAIATGPRWSELAELRIGDLDVDSSRVTGSHGTGVAAAVSSDKRPVPDQSVSEQPRVPVSVGTPGHHQGIANARPLHPLPPPITDQAQIIDLDIRRRQRLGGILNEYHRAV